MCVCSVINLSLFIKNLYASMDEPDGVTGAAAIRKEEPSLHEKILQHESTG